MRSLALLAAALMAACGSAGPGGAPTRSAPPPSVQASASGMDITIATDRALVSTQIAASPDRVWDAVARAYADLGLSIAERSDAGLVLGNSRLVLSRRLGSTPLSRYLECGAGMTGPFADRYRIEMNIRTAVVPDGEGAARVETTLEARARNPEGGSNTGVACASTHRLEGEIAARIRFHAEGA